MLLGREAQQKGTCELLSKARISSSSESIIKSNSLAQHGHSSAAAEEGCNTGLIRVSRAVWAKVGPVCFCARI